MKKVLCFSLLFFSTTSCHADRWILYSSSASINCSAFANGGKLTTAGADVYCADDGGSVTGTAGSVPFFGSDTKITEDNSNLYWDNTNKFLGRGTNSPIAPFHLRLNFSESAPVMQYFDIAKPQTGSPTPLFSVGYMGSVKGGWAYDAGAKNGFAFTDSAGSIFGRFDPVNYGLHIGSATVTLSGTATANVGGSAVIGSGLQDGATVPITDGLIVQGAISGSIDTMTYSGTIALNPALGNLHKTTTVNATGNATINGSSAGRAGQHLWVLVINDATSGKTITFGTNFKTTGTVVGTTSKAAAVSFVSDGSSFYEVSRSTGL